MLFVVVDLEIKVCSRQSFPIEICENLVVFRLPLIAEFFLVSPLFHLASQPSYKVFLIKNFQSCQIKYLPKDLSNSNSIDWTAVSFPSCSTSDVAKTLPMAMITSAPMSNTNLPSTLVHEKNRIPHLDSDASFSSYLHKKETFASLDPQGQLGIGSQKINNGEISIFAAEKYYNGGTGDGMKAETAKNHLRKHHSKQLEGRVYMQNAKPKIGPGTPSTVSSASSWNSHKTLLPDSLKEKPRNVGNALSCKRLLAMFSCKCSCSDEKSVEVDETVTNKTTLSSCKRNFNYGGNFPSKVTTEAQAFVSQDQISAIGTIQTEIQSEELDAPVFELPREDCFTFPVVSSGIDNLTIEKPVFLEEEGKDRKSLEVFGSPLSDDDGARALSLERRVAMLTLSFTKSMKGIAATSVNSGISMLQARARREHIN